MSLRKSLKTSLNKPLTTSGDAVKSAHISGTVIAILYNILVLIYVVSLEDKMCRCITDWRHDFIKYYSIALILWGFITIAFNLIANRSKFVMILKNILMVAALINVWCLYTYVGDLDKTNCSCAIDKQKNMHYFLYLWRYVLVGALILALVGVIMVSLK
jgi:hypothetical protein